MRTRTQWLMAWSVMATLLLASAPLPAKERKGAQVVVQLKDGSSVSGELLMVKRDGLVIGNGGAIVGLADVRSLRIVRRSKGGYGFLFGLIGGTFLGYELARKGSDLDAGSNFMMSAAFLGLPFALIGAGIGLLAGADLVRNPREWEPESYLAELNRHARVPDASFSPGQQ